MPHLGAQECDQDGLRHQAEHRADQHGRGRLCCIGLVAEREILQPDIGEDVGVDNLATER
jgi:hypothetical protein